MAMLKRSLAVGALLVTLAPSALAKDTLQTRRLLAEREHVADATVTLPERSCAAVVAGARDRVVTAAHCVTKGATAVQVETQSGELLSASVAYLDRDRDLAVLGLDRELPVTPLALGSELPQAGTQVLFVGRVDRPSRTQVVRVERLDKCPSLPEVPQALFTSVRARPGDSGAPLVVLADGVPRLVGLVHGGARCHIATPTAPLAALPAVFGSPAGKPLPPATTASPSDATPSPALESKHLGPFVFERTQNGFRFSFQFKYDWSSEK
jgi:hypothetical protein